MKSLQALPVRKKRLFNTKLDLRTSKKTRAQMKPELETIPE